MNRASHLMLCSVLLPATPALADMGKTAEPLIAQGGSKAESHTNTGIEHYGMGRWDVPKNHSVEAEKADPQSVKAQTPLGLVLDKSGNLAGARVHFNRALGLGKNNVDIQNSEILKKHGKM